MRFSRKRIREQTSYRFRMMVIVLTLIATITIIQRESFDGEGGGISAHVPMKRVKKKKRKIRI